MEQNSEMEFQRARTREQIETRREEILNACEALFQECDLDAITLKAIAERTSISRTSLYSYYQTRDDVLLGVLEREYLGWLEALQLGLKREEPLAPDELCAFLTDSMLGRTTMRRLLSVNLTDIEKNCSMEKLKAFKKNAVVPVHAAVESLIDRTFPEADAHARERFFCLFFLLAVNMYPFTHPTPKQAEACKEAGMSKPSISERDLCYTSLLALATTLGQPERTDH